MISKPLILVAVAPLSFPCSAASAESSEKPQKKPAKTSPAAVAGSTEKKRAATGPGRPHRSPKANSGGRDVRTLEIKGMTLSARDGWLGAGSVIGVSLNGTPAAEAVFDIPGLAHSVKLREESPGRYAGTYKVPSNKNVCLDTAAILGCLRDGEHFSPPAAAQRLLKIDAAPPVIEQVYPRPSAQVVRMRVPILAQISDQKGSGLAAERARLLLDEDDVSDSLVITNGSATYLPPNDLEPGEHSVHLMVYDRAGNMRSQSWRFTIVDSQYSIRSVVTNSDRVMVAGDTFTANLEGMWGGKALLVIGEKVEVPLKEQSPGFYEGSYTLRKGDVIGSAPLEIRFTTSENAQYFETLEQSLRMAVADQSTPTITHPPNASWTGDQLVVRGKGAPRSNVRVRVTYRAVLNRIPISGTIAEQHVRVGADSAWECKSIEKSPLLARAAAQFEMTVSPAGEGESE